MSADDAARLAEKGDFAGAAAAQREANAAGYEGELDGRVLLAWYLLRAGERSEPDALFDELRAERGPGDVEIDVLAAQAHRQADLGEEAVALYDRALATARRAATEWIDEVLVQRRELRAELGMEPDVDDEEALELVSGPSPRSPIPAVPWFPPAQQPAAAERWPEIAEGLADPDLYARRVDEEARAVYAAQGRRPAIAPVDVAALVAWADERGLDADRRSTLDAFAATLHEAGAVVAWPPGRNDPCWCGSGRKHKRCCGR